ncbi:hypothetical protein BDR05DRAFT_627105 [Suillus weaverae]|nr:hypothetical protein BDR05DRAFT_627105 [Suillus weaverae]
MDHTNSGTFRPHRHTWRMSSTAGVVAMVWAVLRLAFTPDSSGHGLGITSICKVKLQRL